MKILLLVVSQILFSFSRTLNVRYTAKNNMVMGVVSSSFVKITWLVSASLGVESIVNGDYVTAIIYVVSGIVGDYLSFKVKV